MSEATKVKALELAITAHGAGAAKPEVILATAAAFDAFISGQDAPAKAPIAPKVEAPKPAAAKPAAPVKAAAPKPAAPAKVVEPEPEPEPSTDDDSVGGATKEQVGEAVETLLNANQRKQVVALFAKYNAKSLSGVKPEDYDAILAEANDLLLNA